MGLHACICLVVPGVFTSAVASAAPAAAERSLTIGVFAHTLDHYLKSSPAMLAGIDLTYDHPLSRSAELALRSRVGAAVHGDADIDGIGPRAELGVVSPHAIAKWLTFDVALLAGLSFGGLHGTGPMPYEERVGPTMSAEATVSVRITDHAVVRIGAGYRVQLWTDTDHDSEAGTILRIGSGGAW